MKPHLRSLRGRFFSLALLLWLLLLPAAFYTQNLVNETTREGMVTLHEQSDLTDGLKKLKNALRAAESGVYQYAILVEEPVKQRVLDHLREGRRQIQRLRGTIGERDVARLESHVASLLALLDQLRGDVAEFFELMSRIESRYPAVPILVEELNPADREFMGAVGLTIESSEQGTEAHRLFTELRYHWTQIVNAGRVAMMARAGVFGIPDAGMRQFHANRQLYADTAERLLDRIDTLDQQGGLTLEQSEAAAELRTIKGRFDAGYRRAMEIYRGDNWRTDLPFLRDRLRPQFTGIWSTVYLFEERLGELTTDHLFASLNTADNLSNLVWAIFGFVSLVILFAYWLFEFAIRRPIGQVARALEAEGHGASFVPRIDVHTEETDRLLEAFSGMRDQVHSRQVRLQSLLDNAAEGIITIDEHGIIEIFNNAAQKLFGYQADEVVGRNVSILLPSPHREAHDDYLARYRESGERHIIDREREVEGRHRDGTLILLSLKVSEIELNGRRLFSALVADIRERKAMMDHLRHLAEHDTVTGLYNRQYLLTELERSVERARRAGGECCSLLYIDLDNFKYVNDTLGHLAGDRVLVEVAELLQHRARKGDLLGRLGGDEFAVILYDLDLEGARAAAEGYRKLLADYAFRYDGKSVDVGCSIGVAQFGDGIGDKEELMARADVACHIAKRGGRNRVHVYRDDDRGRVDAMETDMGWSRRIKAAIEHDHFRFARQPIALAHGGAVVGHELLLRLNGGDEVIMPSGFLPAAERFGLLGEIDLWVVTHGIALAADRLRLEPDATFAINLSAKAIGDPALLNAVTDALARHRLPAERLTFEVTETHAVADLRAAADFLRSLRELGCRTALDDFGTGYSSFAYLQELPVDLIKIDGSFIRELADNELRRALIKAMVDIARTIDIRTVAEFVEDEATAEILRDLGVDYLQGYHIGRPELL